jgi:hypothetical protein
MKCILTETKDDFRYEVFVDDHDLMNIYQNDASSFDFGNKEENQDYANKFLNEELCSYGVKVMKLCKCCNEWPVKEFLWAIHAESAEDALKCFKEQMEE